MKPDLHTGTTYSAGAQDIAVQQNRVLRNTYLLLAISLSLRAAPIHPWLVEETRGSSLEERIQPPTGYVRVPTTEGSFASWLRGLPLRPVFRGDRTRIHQLLSNLIDNAIKFTPVQGTVSLSLFTKDKNLEFRVTDTGIGIPDADKPNIFKSLLPG